MNIGEQFAFFRWHAMMWPNHGPCQRHLMCWRLWDEPHRGAPACKHGNGSLSQGIVKAASKLRRQSRERAPHE